MLITGGTDRVAEAMGFDELVGHLPVAVLDEIHKYSRWKSFLKDFFDSYADRCRLVVTGSSRLDVFKRGGDSLMGRYFLYRMHPLSVAELITTEIREEEIGPPGELPRDTFEQLLEMGGFPEPLVQGSRRFYNRWRRLRTEQLLREDLRDLTRVQEIGQIQVLGELLQHQIGQQVSYSSLASQVSVSVDTIRRWLAILESLYFCFLVRPWYRSVPKSLRKQPKVFLWDWSLSRDPGARRENMVASHLHKAVHFWTDAGLGEFGLHYLRDKAKREVDFLVSKDGDPWFIVEVKSSQKRSLSPNLKYFQNTLTATHAFQLAFDMDYVERDCFSINHPVRVPALTFLSQLI